MPTNQKRVLITGAGSGMGRQLAMQLLQSGHIVAGVDRNAQGLEQLALQLEDAGPRFAWTVADVTQADALAAEIGHLQSRLGPIDLLIASAGVAGETPAVPMQAEAIAHIIGINLIGVSNSIAAILPSMLARGTGHVVAISSLASYHGLPAQMGYCASKAGLNALMESLWLDVRKHGIFVTTVCPGHTRTPQATGMYKDAYLMPVERAATEILAAIDRRKRFHAFPYSLALQLRLLRLLPAWLQDWLLERRLHQIKLEVPAAAAPPMQKEPITVA